MTTYKRPRWLKSEAVYIECLSDSVWQDDSRAGMFGNADAALEYLQTHLADWPAGTHLRIEGTLFKIMPDGLYMMSAHRGYRKFEGVQS